MPDPVRHARILLVDDTEANRYAIGRILKKGGYQIIEAATGQEALARAAEDPDLIILDVNLPDISGYEVCQRLKSRPETLSIPILHLSASFVRPEDQARGLNLGSDAYLTQPVEDQVLLATINALLRSRQAEEALRRSEAALRQRTHELQAILDVLPAAVWMASDPSGSHIVGNRAADELMGVPRGTNVSQTAVAEGKAAHFVQYKPDGSEYAPEELPIQRSMVLGRPIYGAEVDVRLGDGRQIWILGNAVPLFDDTGAVRGSVAAFVDITDRKRLDAELRAAKQAADRANAAKDEFLAVLSHELRTPLTPALLLATMLEEDTAIPAPTRQDIATIRRNIEMEATLIDDLLDLTRIAHGKLRLSPRLLDLGEVLDRAVDVCRADAERKRLRLSLELEAKHTKVMADPARLQQVFWNLIKNAVKFTPDGGSIVVRCRTEPGQPLPRVVASVEDNGIGIEPAKLSRIFDAFEQGHATTPRLFGGLGLGLSIAKRLVELHEGRISARSDGSGRGAVFTVELPAAPAEASDDGTVESAAARASARCENLEVLLVEDHTDSARALSRLLQSFGHRVHTADSLATAVAVAQSVKFDVLISDLGLPDGSGLDLMRALRAKRPLVGIALSGYGTDEDIRRSREAGFVDHLTKPIDFHQLQEAMARVIARVC